MAGAREEFITIFSDDHSPENPLDQVIRKNYTYIIRELRVIDVIDDLIQEGVLPIGDNQRIRAEITEEDQCRKFLDILRCRSPEDKWKFMGCLERSLQKYIWEKLKSTAIDQTSLPLSESIKARETLHVYLKLCLGRIFTEDAEGRLIISTLLPTFQEEVNKAQLPHTVEMNDLIEVVTEEYSSVRVDKQGTKKKSRKKKQSDETAFVGLSLRASEVHVNESHLNQKKETAAGNDDTEIASNAVLQSSSGSDNLMDEWTVDNVVAWLSKLDIDENIKNRFAKETIAGDVLRYMTREDITEICHNISFVHSKRIIIARDKCLKDAVPDINHSEICSGKPKPAGKIPETPRRFDTDVTPTVKYRLNHFLPDANKHTGDPLTPVQNYIMLPSKEHDARLFFEKYAMEFTCAMLNEHSDGTLYFGVQEDGMVCGVPGTVEEWSSLLQESINKFFYPDQREKITKCLRPLKFVEVVDSSQKLQKYHHVIEMDVIPAHAICKDEAFFMKKKMPRGAVLLRYTLGRISEVKGEEQPQYMTMKSRLGENRKKREEERRLSHKVPSNLGLKLKQLLCRGEETMDGDIFPILVMNSIPNGYTPDEMKKNYMFLKDLPWKLVFDFSDGNGIYQYLEETEEKVLKILTVEDFDQSNQENKKNQERLPNLLQDLRGSSHQPWIFSNGYAALNMDPIPVVEWKKTRSKGFKEAARYIENDIPKGRAVVIFMLFSKEYDVMLEAADELAQKFSDQWFTIADSLDVAEEWQTCLSRRSLVVDKKDLDDRSVIGIPWHHVNDTIYTLLGTASEELCELPTSNGAIVNLSKKSQNDWIDLEILSSNQCKIDEAEGPDEQFEAEVEAQFYRGQEVNWWNFFFKDHVLERRCVQGLVDHISNVLAGNCDEENRVARVDLFHQPGAGGSTTGKQVLWKMKDKYRCAVIKKITNQTCDQVIKFHIYEDKHPKPVLLLFDNLEDDKVSSLRAELEEKAKQMSRHGGSPAACHVFYVFLICTRQTSLPRGRRAYYCVLKHELEKEEQSWFKRRNRELNESYQTNAGSRVNPKHLISFNIMKENFNEEFIEKNVTDFLSEVSDENEKLLLKYIALLNAYDGSFQSLPASAFIEIMEKNEISIISRRWELHLSQPLQILLNQKKTGQGQHIRLIHNTLSKKVLNILIADKSSNSAAKQTLSEVVHEFLDSGLFNMVHLDNSTEQLVKVVRDVVKLRQKNPAIGRYETKFAPLVEGIIEQSSGDVDIAAEVLHRMYKMSSDVFIGQQLARLYIHSRNWEKARQYAEDINERKKDNSFLLDTYGNSYKEQVREKYRECTSKEVPYMSIDDAVYIVDIAFRAIDIFQEEQEVSETEKTMYVNNAGYFQELETATSLLDSLSIVEELKGGKLHNVLAGRATLPSSLSIPLGSKRIERLMKVKPGVNKALARLEDEHLQLRDDMADEYRKSRWRMGKQKLIRFKENFDNYYGEENDAFPENFQEYEKCEYRRRRIFRLAGHTFRAVFELRSKENGQDTLRKILQLSDANLNTIHRDIFDLQTMLSVNLTLCSIDEKFKEDLSRDLMANRSKELYTLYDSRHNKSEYHLEPYLFATMFNWPQQSSDKKQPIPAEQIGEIIRNWKEAFYKKYPSQKNEGRIYRKKETTMFFLGNGEGMGGIAFDKELRLGHGMKRNFYFWMSPHVLRRLERWTGILINDGAEVRLTIEQVGNKIPLTIPTSLPILTTAWWNKKVYLVIGFTWCGPKAFDIDIEDPRNKPSREHAASQVPGSDQPPQPTVINIYNMGNMQIGDNNTQNTAPNPPQAGAVEGGEDGIVQVEEDIFVKEVEDITKDGT